MKINLLVVRTSDPEELKLQYEKIGFQFVHHSHGNGPMHYSCSENDFVFEIYPSDRKNKDSLSNLIRLGFSVKNLEKTIEEIKDTNWKIVAKPNVTEWGKVAVVQDLDGRKVELKEQQE